MGSKLDPENGYGFPGEAGAAAFVSGAPKDRIFAILDGQ